MTRHATTTPLHRRIRLHKPGQLTWPEPALNKWCQTCRHFDNEAGLRALVGACSLVKQHQNVVGKLFNSGEAIACPHHED